MATISIPQFAQAMKRLGNDYPKAVIAGMRAGLLISQRAAKFEFMLSGGGPANRKRLTSRTGRLRDTIRIREPKQKGPLFEGALQAGSGSVKYARIHERGGITRAHTIVPKRARVLRFIKNGRVIFARSVRHPGSRMPHRAYLEPALRKRGLPQTQKQIALAIKTLAAKLLRR